MKRNYILIIGFLVGLVFTTNSCKDPAQPKATVTVIGTDKNGNEINQEGAIVIVRADPDTHDSHGNVGHVRPDLESSEGLTTRGVTDGSGMISFEFKYEAILRVYAYIVPKKTDTIWGEGALILKEDDTYSETVYLRYHSGDTNQ